MKFGIIAAGEGSRLTAEGVATPKPLVALQGEPIIDRLINIFMNEGADEIAVICNSKTDLVERHLLAIQRDGLGGRQVPLRFVVKSTPSSMHSFSVLSPLLEGGPFVLTTVDTVFLENEFHTYITAFKEAVMQGWDGMMGVTDYIDDEKPLYVATDEQNSITAFQDSNEPPCRYISGGIYGLTSSSLETLHRCMERGESRMRNFQRGLLRDGRKLKAFAFSKVLDIDHVTDLEKAQAFLMQGCRSAIYGGARE